MSGVLVDFGQDMAARIKSCLSAVGYKSNDWEVHEGVPGNPRGYFVWPQIEAVEYNIAHRGRASIMGVVNFGLVSEGKAVEVNRRIYRLMDSSGFAHHWQQPPYPDGYDHLVSKQFVVEKPLDAADATFAVVSLQFTGMV